MTVVEQHTNREGYVYELLQDEKFGNSWSVRCYTPGKDGELHWEVNGKVTMDDGFRQTREPFTEQTAREEYARWSNT